MDEGWIFYPEPIKVGSSVGFTIPQNIAENLKLVNSDGTLNKRKLKVVLSILNMEE